MSKEHKLKYLACLAAGLFSFYNLFQLSLFNVISGHLLVALRLTTTELGLFSGCFLLANAIGLVPIGLMLDRGLMRKVALFFLTLTACASFVIAISSSLLLSCLMRFFQGLASAASLLICIRVVNSYFAKNTNLMLGALIALALSGGIFGNFVFASVVHYIGWQSGLYIISILGLLLVTVIWLFLYENKDMAFFQNRCTPISELKFLLQKKHTTIIGIYCGLMNLPVFILATLWGNFYLSHRYPISAIEAAIASSLLFGGVMLGSLSWGYLADKYLTQPAVMYLGCSLLFLLSLLFLIPNLSFLEIALIFFGFGFCSSSQNIVYAIINKNNPSTIRSTTNGIAMLISNGIGALSQVLFGWLLYLKIPIGLLNVLPILLKQPFSIETIFFPFTFLACLILVFFLQPNSIRSQLKPTLA